MAHNISLIQIFVASPGDVQAERDVLGKIVEEINRNQGNSPRFWLRLRRWEQDVYPDLGRPQAVVNQQIGEYDIFIGIMWKRFGTPTGIAASGTEEEFNRAYEKYQQTQKPSIHFFFRTSSEQSPVTPEERDQLRKVKEFRLRVEQMGIVGRYANVEDFRSQARHLLNRKISERLNESSSGPATEKLPSNGVTKIPSASPPFTNIPMPEIQKPLTDLDRRNFLQEGFHYIRTYFQQAVQDLKSQHEIVDVNFQEDTDHSLIIEFFLQRQSRNRCHIWITDQLGTHTIAYAEGRGYGSLDGHTMNDFASVTENAGQLAFSLSGMDMFSSVKPGQHVNPEGLAEYFWRRATRPLGS